MSLRVSEEPPGGGPVAALAAGLAVLGETAALDEAAAPAETAVLAADLPFLTGEAVLRLRHELARQSTVDGVVYVDGAGRYQTLCGVWRTEALQVALRGQPHHHGAASRPCNFV